MATHSHVHRQNYSNVDLIYSAGAEPDNLHLQRVFAGDRFDPVVPILRFFSSSAHSELAVPLENLVMNS